MANLFIRIKDAMSADLHDLLDTKEEKNPMSMLNHYLREGEKEAEKVRKLVERQHTLKSEFSREYLDAKEMAEKRKRQSDIAAKAGEDQMRDFAIKEYEEYAKRSERLLHAQIEAENELEHLERRYQEMLYKLKEMRLKRMEMMGRENVARANVTINRVMEEAGHKAVSRFNDMDRYLTELQNKVDRAYYKETFDSKMADLEKKISVEKKGKVLSEN